MSRLDKIPGLVLRKHQQTEADLAAIGEPNSAKRSARCRLPNSFGPGALSRSWGCILHKIVFSCGRHLLPDCWLAMAVLRGRRCTTRVCTACDPGRHSEWLAVLISLLHVPSAISADVLEASPWILLTQVASFPS